MLLLKNGKLYSPDFKGVKDILIANGKILKIDNNITLPQDWNVEIIFLKEQFITPGFIDHHVHIAGAGGEGGPSTRTPPVHLSRFIKAGITGVVGLLGTDGVTRDLKNLLMKVKALNEEGISAWMYVGSYEIPVVTLTGNINSDLALFDEAIGVGEVAFSDHRSSSPTVQEIIRLASQARVGAMLGDKPGVVHLHIGEGKDGFNPIIKAVENSDIPINQFIVTHVNRSREVLEGAIEFGLKGGFLDITSGVSPEYGFEQAIKPSKAILELMDAGIPIEQITMSSDGNGSMPNFDENGNLVGLLIAPLKSLYKEFKDIVVKEGVDLNMALNFVSTNIANNLEFENKGEIKSNKDADLLVFDDEMNLKYVIAKGKILMKNEKLIAKGTFE